MRLIKGSPHTLQHMQNLRSMKMNLKGSGFIDDIKNIHDKVNKYKDAIVYGRNDYQPKVREILNNHGKDIIISAVIIRNPIQKAMINILNAISMGSFQNKLDKSEYDKLFHLQLVVTTNTGLNISIEKNEVIYMKINPQIPQFSESSIVTPLTQGLTIQSLMDNTKSYMKNSFFYYSAKTQNCQDFVLGILNANHIGNEENRLFTKQNTDQLFDNSDFLRKFSNSITDLGARVNVIKEGAGNRYRRRQFSRIPNIV